MSNIRSHADDSLNVVTFCRVFMHFESGPYHVTHFLLEDGNLVCSHMQIASGTKIIGQYVTVFFFNFPLYLQSVPIYSANVVKSYTKACRRVLTSTLLYLIGLESSCDLGSVTYKLNLKNYIYILNLVDRSTGKFFHNRLVSGGS
jgi:hypothetical protein